MEPITLVGAIKAGSAAGFEGWASTAQLDRQGDVVQPSAFASSLPAFKANGPIFWNHAEVHDPLAMPIGRTTDAEIRDGGLYIKARWANTPQAQQVRQLVTDGIVSTMSIGFNPISSRPGKGGINVIDDLELMEVSVVAIPANTGAIITAAKTLTDISTKDAADDVSMGAQCLAMLAALKDEESDDPEDAALIQHAMSDLLAWLGTETAEIGTAEDNDGILDEQGGMAAEQEAAPMMMAARPRRIARLRSIA